jgi:outer membrane lipoprotein SlyB
MRPALGLVLLLAACAPRPVLYRDDAYDTRGGKPAADAAVKDCRAKAKEDVGHLNLRPVASHTGWGAATGAAMGAVTGLITGDLGKAAASGAAIGGAAGLGGGAYEASRPDQVERAYTDRCLSEKGWTVLGWR